MFYSPKLLNYTPSLLSEGGKSSWPYFDSKYFNASTLAGTGLSLGDMFYLTSPAIANYVYNGANAFMVVKASEGLAVGNLVTYSAPTAVTVTTTSTNYRVDFTTSPLTAGAEVGNLVYVNNATTQMLRVIKENATGTVTVSKRDPLNPSTAATNLDADVFDTVPANSDPACIIRPFNVRLCTAALRPIGVALGTVTSGYYTIIQVAGLAMVSTVGSGTATVVGVPAVPGASANILGSGGTASSYAEAVSMIPLYAWNGAARLTPCFVNFMASA